MKKVVPWALFAASAVFNVFFLAGMAATEKPRQERPGPEQRVAFLSKKLDLDEAQQSAVLELEKTNDSERTRIDAEHEARFGRLIDELVKDDPSEEVLRDFVEDKSAADRDRHFVDRMSAMMKILRPEQRAKVADWLRRSRRTRVR